jgi:predicted MFS family arabinose efflux permease
MKKSSKASFEFTKYQVFMIVILALIQFTVVLDFMVLSPLSAFLIPALHIKPVQFGMVVSGYAFSAGISGLLAAGFADKFDRKKLLVFFYTGFLLGTVLCAVATSYQFLLVARIVTGLFGGVISSIGMAIVADLYKIEMRGRVMGFIQMAFGVSQVLGLPIGLWLAEHMGWHSTFWMVAGFGLLLGIVIVLYMKPITGHLQLQHDRNVVQHLVKTISYSPYLLAFLTTTLLATGGFMLMPFGAAFSVNNIGLTTKQLPLLYGIAGAFTFIAGPLIGYLSDKIGKYAMFLVGTVLSMAMVAIYTQLGVTPFWQVAVINVIMFAGIMGRIITSSALVSVIPQPADRGAFMSINSSVQQISGGIASFLAGLIIYQATPTSQLQHYDTLGYIVMGSMVVVAVMMYFINRQINRKMNALPQAPQKTEFVALAE